MSQINTNGINVNYPVPGVNNNSQGFRDNFAAIRTNLNTASTEITDLQNNVVVKSALANTIVNNDMANTLISNALTRSFRASTYNLGNNISNTIVINASLGDVQYGTISGNTTIQFAGWAPSGTQSNLQLELNVSNANAVISFPSQVSMTGSYGVETLENFANVGNVATVSIPYGVSQLEYRLSTIDCGNTITIEPFNRPRIDTQIQQRTPAPTGFPGDVAGTVSVSPAVIQLPISSSNSADYFTTSGTTTGLYTDLPVVFTGTSMEANIVVGTTYYVRNVVSSNTFTVSSTSGGANVNLAGNASPTEAMFANPASYLYICTDSYNSVANTVYVKATTVTTNKVTIDDTAKVTANDPIILSANIGGLIANTVYYVVAIADVGANGNISVSATRTNGIAGANVTLSNASGNISSVSYNGTDIWKRIQLTSW
jgi:hypothetical protein